MPPLLKKLLSVPATLLLVARRSERARRPSAAVRFKITSVLRVAQTRGEAGGEIGRGQRC